MALLLKYRGGSENEVSGSAQPWDSTNVPGDIVDCEHGGNGREFWEGDEVLWNALDMYRTTVAAGDCS